jgi:hypothetical protein
MPRERVTFEVIHDHPSGELKFWRHDLARAFLNCQKLGIVVDRWIPVTDRLPERNEKVLVVDEGGVNIGSYSPMLDDWWSLHGDAMAPGPKVTHWMPLPEPPVRS